MAYQIDLITANTIESKSITLNGEPVGTKPYRVYSALLTQTGTTSPVATVLENTLEQNLIYTYNNPGVYYINGNFPIDKTIVFLTMNYYTPLGYLTGNATINKIDETTIILKTFAIDTTPTDALLYNTSIEIRVYN